MSSSLPQSSWRRQYDTPECVPLRSITWMYFFPPQAKKYIQVMDLNGTHSGVSYCRRQELWGRVREEDMQRTVVV